MVRESVCANHKTDTNALQKTASALLPPNFHGLESRHEHLPHVAQVLVTRHEHFKNVAEMLGSTSEHFKNVWQGTFYRGNCALFRQFGCV